MKKGNLVKHIEVPEDDYHSDALMGDVGVVIGFEDYINLKTCDSYEEIEATKEGVIDICYRCNPHIPRDDREWDEYYHKDHGHPAGSNASEEEILEWWKADTATHVIVKWTQPFLGEVEIDGEYAKAMTTIGYEDKNTLQVIE